MSRRNHGGKPVGISLFAFLDVLICTMGSLIILLAMFMQQAKVSAQTEVAAEREAAVTATAAEREKLQTEKEEHEWRQQVLEQQRQEKTQELSDAADRLSHLEDHIRRLKAHAEDLLKLAADIDRGNQLKDEEGAAAEKELVKTRAEIERLKKEAELARKKIASAERWFALIPYDGPNGTRRRPIYIECTMEGITLQPENVTLLPGDFNGPLGPGNPLDAALRAKREYLNRAGETATPYPLLIVRPDGIVAYQTARAAMKSWDDEFGYELIDGEKKLTFGDADPTLASLMQSTVRSARQRQAAYASSAPRKFAGDDGVILLCEDVLPPPPAGAGGGVGRGGGTGRGVGGTGNGNGGGGVGVGAGNRSGSDALGGPGGNANKGNAGQTKGGGIGNGTGGTAAGSTGTGKTGNGPYASGGTDSSATGEGGVGGDNAAGAGAGQAGQAGAAGSGGTGGNMALGSSAAKAMGNGGGANSRTGGNQAGGSAGDASGTSGAKSASTVVSGASGSSGGDDASGATPSSTFNMSANKRPSRRGNNWGLPGAQSHATAITRPIRVVLQSDKLVIMPERGDDRLPKEIPLKNASMTPQEADLLVASVQKHMQNWGVAVENGYWKPLLNVEVAPTADERYHQVETALQGSGFEMKRR